MGRKSFFEFYTDFRSVVGSLGGSPSLPICIACRRSIYSSGLSDSDDNECFYFSGFLCVPKVFGMSSTADTRLTVRGFEEPDYKSNFRELALQRIGLINPVKSGVKNSTPQGPPNQAFDHHREHHFLRLMTE